MECARLKIFPPKNLSCPCEHVTVRSLTVRAELDRSLESYETLIFMPS